MAIIEGKKIKIFSLSANRPLAEEIAKTVGCELGVCEVNYFADGEINMNIPETVRGHHVFVVQPTQTPVNDTLMEVLIMCDALKRASALTINLIIPYYGYSRQDKKSRSRHPISAKLVADLIQTAGANRVIAMDLHAAQIQGFFDIPIDNFLAMPILAQYLLKKKFKNIVVVSPDHGGATRARMLANYLSAPMAIIDKNRPEPNKAEVMNIIGEVKGKTAILIDDMVDTGGSLMVAAEALMNAGSDAVYAACTHPILSGDASDRILKSSLKELICTNTVFLPDSKRNEKIVQLSVGKVLGQGIIKILDDEPLSGLFQLETEEIR
ncbi:MAG: ribose-phosphate pyrophosphokinase [Erysipelotrichales bacterium]|nr:ribose-phosphate pyrophosphokinase [Erysipelotrichales bacterium]